jgi:uncharacterized protein (TIGR02246 family)
VAAGGGVSVHGAGSRGGRVVVRDSSAGEGETREAIMTNEERALHKLVYQLESSWNAGDGDAFASLFAENADVIHILGGYYTGRETIRAGHRMIFGTIYKGSTVHYRVEKIKFLRPEIALIFLRQHLELGEAAPVEELDARPTIVAEKAEEVWRIVLLQNTRISEVGSAKA